MGNLVAAIAPESALSTVLYPPSSTFEPERDMPDLSGIIAVVTGGNSGIGYHTVEHLLLKNARVYLAARPGAKSTAAVRKLEAETGRAPVFLELDLADLTSVRRAATTFLAQESRLDVLFNNAGVMAPPVELLTAQNHDLPFGTNVIGHYFLTQLLLPALAASSAVSGLPARIIYISSATHLIAPSGGIAFASLKGGPERDAWLTTQNSWVVPWRLYGQSKLANIVVSNHFAKTHSDILVSCALHPGCINTPLKRHTSLANQLVWDLLLYPASIGAVTQLWAGTTASPAQITGQYLIPWARIGRAAPIAANAAVEARLIAYLQEQIVGF
ncbi:NAD(P)-binding protein [Mycena pura]|uniref:NAD(P)-binding protein n=1 Tax=Mycena pura TaxID=153505 RepID=A0AAD7E2F5_9AGAR|nr:NAD(P)-binding protein [Mycena pura]